MSQAPSSPWAPVTSTETARRSLRTAFHATPSGQFHSFHGAPPVAHRSLSTTASL